MKTVEHIGVANKQLGFVPQSGSPFLNIPLELRQQIYEYHFRRIPMSVCFSAGSQDDAPDEDHEYEEAGWEEYFKVKARLLLTCQQVCEEGRPIYARNLEVRIEYPFDADIDPNFSIQRDAELLSEFFRRSLQIVTIHHRLLLAHHVRPLQLKSVYPNLQLLIISDYECWYPVEPGSSPESSPEYWIGLGSFYNFRRIDDEQLLNHVVDCSAFLQEMRATYNNINRDEVPQLTICFAIDSRRHNIYRDEICRRCHLYLDIYVLITMKTNSLTRYYENERDVYEVQNLIMDNIRRPELMPAKDFSCKGLARHEKLALVFKRFQDVQLNNWIEKQKSDQGIAQ